MTRPEDKDFCLIHAQTQCIGHERWHRNIHDHHQEPQAEPGMGRFWSR